MPSFQNELHLNDSEIALALAREERRQQDGVELIPSENYTYPEVLELLGSVFTNKYSEGYPGRRYYGGQEFTDQIENLARQRACALFRAEHANVQPLSGSPMNQAVYLGLLNMQVADRTHPPTRSAYTSPGPPLRPREALPSRPGTRSC